MRATILGIVITVWWLVMMATLAHRFVSDPMDRSAGPPLDTATLAESWRDVDEWMRLTWSGLPIGMMRTVAVQETLPAEPSGQAAPESKTDPENATVRYRIAVLIGLEIGTLQGRLTTSALLNDRLILDRFNLTINLGAAGKDETLRISGLARGLNLFLRLERGEALQIRTFRLSRPVALAESLRPLFGRADLKVGDTYTLPVFDPIWNLQGGTLSVHVAAEETLRVAGRETDVLRIETRTGSVKSTAWVDDQGRVWKRVMPPVEMVAIDPDRALEQFPWMETLPPPPSVTLEDFQEKEHGKAFGSRGLLGLLQDTLAPSEAAPEAQE